MIRLRVLGQCVVEVKRKSVRPDAELVFATLLYLCAERGRRVERDALAELMWPRESATRRRHSLRQILYKLRRLGVECGDSADALEMAESTVWLDFEDADAEGDADTGRELLAPSGVQCLPGYAPRFSKRFSAWLDEFRLRVEGATRTRFASAIARARQKAQWTDVERLARNCLKLDPLNEEATLALAEATALAGAKSRALEMLDAYVRELGPDAGDVKLPATVLRRRIADRFPSPRATTAFDTPLVGREGLMSHLTSALDRMCTGQPAVHAIWGPSGIGKTRILDELVRLASLKGIAVASQRAGFDDQQAPGFTFVRLVRAMLQMPGVLGLAPESLAFLQRLTSHRPSAVTSGGVDESEDALVQAFVDLQRALAWESPLLVVLDDLQHADQFSRRLVGRARGCLSTERILLVVASIPDPSSNGLGNLVAHEVRRLDMPAAARLAGLLCESVGVRASDETQRSYAAACGGHPFLMREAVAASSHRGGPATDASLDAILLQRVRSVSDAARDVLISALILGDNATIPLMLRSVSMTANDAEDVLAELEHDQILSFGTGGTVTTHTLWRSALTRLFPLSRVNARRLHIAQLLEEASADSATGAELLVASGLLLQEAGAAVEAANMFARSAGELAGRALAPAAFSVLNRAADLAPGSTDFDVRLFHALRSATRAHLIAEAAALLTTFAPYLRGSPRLSRDERVEVALIEAEVRQFLVETTPELVARCEELAADRELADVQRLRAAVAGVRAAEYAGMYGEVRALATHVADCSDAGGLAALLKRQVDLVHAVVSRRLPDACDIAESAFAQALADPHLPDRHRLMLSARVPFLFDCNYARAEAILRAAREGVRGYPSTYSALRANDAYATMCIDLMRLDEANEILKSIESIATQYAHAPFGRSLRETYLRLSIARGESVSTETVRELRRETAGSYHARERIFIMADAAVGLARARDSVAVASVVPELSRLWENSLSGCPFDYPCIALAIALGVTGAAEKGEQLVAGYFRETRVASRPPAPFVRSLADEFGLGIRA
ncbi:MAG TPA: AAA family ATPase [Gemmatimonadaceae bacterium]|nr:AAA family ATPase [Gemmatimonadaceae bacterium]